MMAQRYRQPLLQKQKQDQNVQPLSPQQAVHAWSIDQLLRSIVLDDWRRSGKLGEDTRGEMYRDVYHTVFNNARTQADDGKAYIEEVIDALETYLETNSVATQWTVAGIPRLLYTQARARRNPFTRRVIAGKNLEGGRHCEPLVFENLVPILVGLACGTAGPDDFLAAGVDASMLVELQTTGKWYMKLGPSATFRLSHDVDEGDELFVLSGSTASACPHPKHAERSLSHAPPPDVTISSFTASIGSGPSPTMPIPAPTTSSAHMDLPRSQPAEYSSATCALPTSSPDSSQSAPRKRTRSQMGKRDLVPMSLYRRAVDNTRRLQVTRQQARERVDKLDNQLRVVKGKKCVLKQKLQRERQKGNTLAERLKRHVRVEEEARLARAQAESARLAVEAELTAEAEKRLNDLHSAHAHALTDIRKERDQARTDLEAERRQTKELAASVSRLKADLAQSEDARRSSAAALLQTSTALTAAESAKSKADARCLDIIRDIGAVRGERDALGTQLAEAAKRGENREKEVESELEGAIAARKEADRIANEHHQQLSELRPYYAQSLNRISDLERQLERAKRTAEAQFASERQTADTLMGDVQCMYENMRRWHDGIGRGSGETLRDSNAALSTGAHESACRSSFDILCTLVSQAPRLP
ncbi:uncharacterized protein MKK02DRAFT_43433 [Dioszegia hungarica]|uniref:Uncharacterized protein n=1 Tax=Dioszegia hungarica TaxID=4972 RepID=A0AA38HAT0_9TREE|nr:uncharacterized protein MKK02DRAFT_43433 [Dioszegia hungarica]KAI9637508.1 hypothetical protein MKK02DRAFT_43433 [Dioszegia hungarica]